jgi:Zn finger protein HypA/HybF involved in hydrogenase expression
MLAQKIVADAAKAHPKLARGQVWCRQCGATQRVDAAGALARGWPKCCGYTMTIDAPNER